MQTYLFYDIETTGLNKCFDQVLQFAAIRTDKELNEIQRYAVNIKLNPDIIPSPGAVIVHHLGISATQTGLNEYDGIRQIHQLLNEPGTISVGYNTLGFDDEFLRFSFYRNLLPPYTHQYANQCGRMDLYPIAAMYFLYKNDCLKWPYIEGIPKLKLELINAENALAKGRAHDAMVDVEATLALAKHFYHAQDMWKYTLGYFHKQTDQERFAQLPVKTLGPHNLKMGIMVDGSFGSKHNFQAPVICLGEHLHYKNQMLWLRLDTANLRTCTAPTLAETTWVCRKKWAEPGIVIPPKERFIQTLTPDQTDNMQANLQWLAQETDMLPQIISYYRAYTYPELPEADAEAKLYLNGFWSHDEINLCAKFHHNSPIVKTSLVETIKNTTLKTLAIRLLGRHFPNAMTPTLKAEYQLYLDCVNAQDLRYTLTDFKGYKRLTPQAALLEIAELRATALSPEQQHLLDELEDYLNHKF